MLVELVKRRFGIKDAIAKPDLLFSVEYWVTLPDRFPQYKDHLKGKNCTLWAFAARDAMETDGHKGVFKFGAIQSRINDGDRLWKETGVWGHAWLYAENGGKTYIADGTAGQFFQNSEFSDGFYGYLDQAPANLQKLYLY